MNVDKLVSVIPVKKRFDDKYFRAKKIIERWDNIYGIMEGVLERGLYGRTKNAQMAWAILVMMITGIRVGNENSAEGYLCVNAYSKKFNKRVKTYGITTLLKKHTVIRGDKLYLNFMGKKLIKQSFVIDDLSIVDSFKWLFADRPGHLNHNVTLLDVTHYELTKFVKKHIGKQFSIKDIRTAKVNKEFIRTIFDMQHSVDTSELTKKSEANRLAMFAVETTAIRIGHTKGVCKARYVSPNLFTYYKEYLYELLKIKKESR